MPKRAPVHTRQAPAGRTHTTHSPDTERETSTRRGYDRNWRKVRDAKIRIDPLCEICRKQGRVVPAQDVDHIEEIEKRPDLRLSFDNLQSLCRRCHNRKTHGTKRTMQP